MESQEKAIRLSRLIETVIKHAIHPAYRFPQTGGVLQYLQAGIGKLSFLFGIEEVGDERITDYIVYQIYRCKQAIHSGNWKYSWLFSEASINKYRNQFLSENGKTGMNYYIDQWLNQYELSRGDLAKILAPPKPNPLKKLVYLESEEPIKRRWLNCICGVALCQQSTTGWSPFSQACSECRDWIECGKLTAQKYPELMRLRKEAYGKAKR